MLKEQDIKTGSLYSPASLHMALAVLAESEEGDAKQEFLDVIYMNGWTDSMLIKLKKTSFMLLMAAPQNVIL